MPVITCIEDLRRIYARRAPKMFYDYTESGSFTEQTFQENTSDFAKIHLRQRVAIDMTGRTTASKMIGQDGENFPAKIYRSVCRDNGLCERE